MTNRWQKLKKPILFGLCGAGGCLLAATIFGEGFLSLTQQPPIVERNTQEVLLLIDTSGSMDENNKLTEVKQAAKDFIARQNLSQDSFAVVGFGTKVQIGTGLTSDLNTINQAIDNLADGGGTRMDQGIESAIKELQILDPESINKNHQKVNRHILLFTDGQPAPEPPSQKVDIFFVLDVTTSMGQEFSGVQQGIDKFAATISEKNIDWQMGVIAFRDSLAGENFDILSFNGSPFTNDSGYFRQKISQLGLSGGGTDTPESSLDALTLAAGQPFRENATRIVILITDAPPHIPDLKTRSIAEAGNLLVQNQINQLHLVVQKEDLYAFQELRQFVSGDVFLISETASGRAGFQNVLLSIGQKIAETTLSPVQREPIIKATLIQGKSARNQGINLIAAGTGDADRDFLNQLTGNPDQVFYVNTGNFNEAFRAAEKVIYNPLLIESTQGTNEGLFYTYLRQIIPPEQLKNYRLPYSLLRIGSWTALLAIGTSLALIVGQNWYQHRRLLTFKEIMTGTLGGLIAGLTAGTFGQLLYIPLVDFPLLATGGQILGWTILGTMLGVGISFFVPNLKKNRGFLGGCLGGLTGGVGFVIFTGFSGASIGRLIGSATLGFCIGMMIALLELLSRQAKLIVHWNPKEQTTLTLGEQPIIVGSSNQAHVYLSKAQGFFPITAKIFQEGSNIIMQYDTEYGQAKGMKKLRHELKNGDRRQLGQVTLEIQTIQP